MAAAEERQGGRQHQRRGEVIHWASTDSPFLPPITPLLFPSYTLYPDLHSHRALLSIASFLVVQLAMDPCAALFVKLQVDVAP